MMLPSGMSEATFMQHFAELYEHSPWVAERTYKSGLNADTDNLDGLCQAFSSTLTKASHAEKLELICAHPDLAGKAAARNELTEDSTQEQSSAGLDQCTDAELVQFHELNNTYKAKFNFPFIMAVKGSNRHVILAAFASRINNDESTEFETAINEINKIARIRLSGFFDD